MNENYDDVEQVFEELLDAYEDNDSHFGYTPRPHH